MTVLGHVNSASLGDSASREHYRWLAKVPLALDTMTLRVIVMQEGTRLDLADWLETVAPPVCFVTDKAGFSLQAQWYETTRQASRFQDLPMELRLEILEFAFG